VNGMASVRGLNLNEYWHRVKEKVLIVDDDASVRESLRKVLESVGYKVALAANGQEAAKQFEDGQVSLLLLDIGLPVKNGWDTFEHITNKAPALPIIITTGPANQPDMAVAAGVGTLMEKPLDVTGLLVTMEELLAEPVEARARRLRGYPRATRHVLPASTGFLQE
jgi:DNA-binding NtrC family response regulator